MASSSGLWWKACFLAASAAAAGCAGEGGGGGAGGGAGGGGGGGAAKVQMPPAAVEARVPMALDGFKYGDVTLLPGPLERAFQANLKYVKSIDPGRYLYNVRKTAGLPAPGTPFGGWEAADCELRGHHLGHYLSACARLVAQTGDPEIKKRAEYTVAELARCQAKIGNGYVSAFPEELFERVDKGVKVWAPYYTIHKIMLGLWEMHAYTGNAQALEVLRGMAGYFKGRCDRLNDEQMQTMLKTEFGGMEEVLLNLYASTGEPEWRELAKRFRKKSFLEPLAARQDRLALLHANTHLPQINGEARLYELTGDAESRRIVEFFWDTLQEHHTYATGGSNMGEWWWEPNKLAGTLAGSNQEFCTSYNLEKVTRYLLSWTGQNRYADLIEKNFYNGILVSQNPADGMLIYYMPFRTGLSKVHGTPFEDMTCCYGTGIQEYFSLGQNIFYHTDEALFVNLYAAAAVNWQRPGGAVRVRQETRFPEEGRSKITVSAERPTAFKLVLRVPAWIAGPMDVRVNGERVLTVRKPSAGTWLPIDRTWRDGDVVEFNLPMALHIKPMNDDPQLAAVMYGPLVLAGVVEGEPINRGYPAPVLTGEMEKVAEWMKPVAGRPLTFEAEGMRFIPIHQVIDETYGLYWRFARPGTAEHAAWEQALAAAKERDGRTIDEVKTFDEAGEKAHGLAEKGGAAEPLSGGKGRYAKGEVAFLSYRMKVDPEKANTLLLNVWSVEDRTMVIFVDGQKAGEVAIKGNRRDDYHEATLELPAALTKGKPSVVVRFEPGAKDKAVGAVFRVRVVRK